MRRQRQAVSSNFSALGLVAVLAGAAALQENRPSFLDDLLRRQMRFSPAELRALDSGAAVIKTLDTPVRQELAHFGVVYVNAPATRFIEQFREIEEFERGPGILQIGRFGRPPRLEDMASLALPERDVAALPRCRPGDCSVKLPPAAMTRLRTQVRWSSPAAAQQANAVFRAILLDLVRAYQAHGNAGLGRIDDRSEPLPVADEFRALLASGDPPPIPVPLLMAYLDDYPRSRPPGVDDFFYWSLVDFGLKPTLRVNHVVIYPQPVGSPPSVAYAIAIKQLYATHYFHTTLELRFLIEDARPDRRGFYLVSITRSRNDGMTGFTGLFLRPVISGRSQEAVRRYLEHVRRRVEQPAPAGHVG